MMAPWNPTPALYAHADPMALPPLAQVVSTLLTVFVTSGLSPMIGLGMDCEKSGGNWTLGWEHIEAVNECVANGGTDCTAACDETIQNGWEYAGLVWLYCGIWIFVQDAAKLLAMKAFDSADPHLKNAKRQETLGNKQMLARASQASSAGASHSRPSRLSRHSGLHQRSTFNSDAGVGAGLAGPAGASDAMLEPAAGGSRQAANAELRALPDLVAALEDRVRELEAQLTASSVKADGKRNSK